MTSPATYDTSAPAPEEQGYHKGLNNRQVQMIGIGGAIGTGLFMGAGGRLHGAGPGLFVVYAVCGVFVFFILRALGELILHRPSSGSFVSYAREFLGEKAAYVAGWMYFFNWAATAIVDVTAIALYMHYWSAFKAIPQWSIALIALVIVLTMNTISVKLFGEMEFWAALIKVVAIVGFLVIGTVFLAGRFTIEGASTGPSVIADNGGLLPAGLMALVIVTSGVVFAYSAVELVGIAAGETENPETVMPRAINSVVFRVAIFYVGSLILLALLLPYGTYKAGESPFVTFFSRIGVPYAGDVMNFVVLTAALSSLNAGLYSTGRILRSLAMNGSAPKVLSRMTSGGVPFMGIAVTGALTLVGIFMNLVIPAEAFETALDLAALGIIVMGHHRDLPDPALPLVAARHPAAGQFPDARSPVHRVPHAGIPRGRGGADVLRERVEPHRNSGTCPRADRGLVPVPRSRAAARAGAHRIHRRLPGDSAHSHARRPARRIA